MIKWLPVVMLAALTQAGSPADVAHRISGTWKLNLELSPSLTAPGRSGGRSRGSGAAFAVAATTIQRGGRGGGEGGLQPGVESGASIPPEELAAQRVLRTFERPPAEVTIEATPTTVTFKDPNGQGTFSIDGKTSLMDLSSSKIKVKTRWDHAALKQDLSTQRRSVSRVWSVDAANHLVLTTTVQGVGVSMSETRALFDRQP